MTARTAAFLDRLELEAQPDGKFIVKEPLRFYSADLNKTVKAPAGLLTDLASIPPYVPGVFVPKLGKWNYPSVVHDAAYQNQLQDTIGNPWRVSKAVADKLFREGMQAMGVGKVRRNLMYLAVRVFGRGEFQKEAV